MNLQQLYYFQAISRLKNYTKAAEQLHLTQPTMSIFLSTLEKHLGAPLFERVGKKLIPTPVGDAYIRRAQQISALKHDFDREMNDLLHGRQSVLHVGCLRRYSVTLMPRLLGQFQMEYPETTVVLHNADAKSLENMLCSGEMDLIYTNQPPAHSNLLSERIREDRMLMLLSAHHPAVQK